MLEYYNELLYYVQRMVRNKDTASDIIQETYVKTLEKSKKVVIKNERAFLYKVAKNIVIDQSRKEKNRPSISYEEEIYSIPLEEQPEQILLQDIEQEILLDAVNSLPKHLKQVFILHIFDGQSKKEIALLLKLNLNTVQRYTMNATKQLSKYIEENQ